MLAAKHAKEQTLVVMANKNSTETTPASPTRPSPSPRSFRDGPRALAVFLFPNSRLAMREEEIKFIRPNIDAKIAQIRAEFQDIEKSYLQVQILWQKRQNLVKTKGAEIPIGFVLFWRTNQFKYRQYQAFLSDVESWYRRCLKQHRLPGSFQRLGMAIDQAHSTLEQNCQIIDNLSRNISHLSYEIDKLPSELAEVESEKQKAENISLQAERDLTTTRYKLFVAREKIQEEDQRQKEADDLLQHALQELQDLENEAYQQWQAYLQKRQVIEDKTGTLALKASQDKWRQVSNFYLIEQNRKAGLAGLRKQLGIKPDEAERRFLGWVWSMADREADQVYQQVLQQEVDARDRQITALDRQAEKMVAEYNDRIKQKGVEIELVKDKSYAAKLKYFDTCHQYQPLITQLEADLSTYDTVYKENLDIKERLSIICNSLADQLNQKPVLLAKSRTQFVSLFKSPAPTLPSSLEDWPAIPAPVRQLSTSQLTDDYFADQFKDMRIGQKMAHDIYGFPYP